MCPTADRCWPRETSAALHRAETGAPETVQLPIGAWSTVYVRVDPEASALALDYLTVGAELVIVARPDGAPEITLHHGRSEEEGWHHVAVDLAPFRGLVVQLRLRPEPLEDRTDRRCSVRRMAVEDLDARPRPTRAGARSDARPNVVLYVVDTLRADRLGCYGYPRATSPRMDAFARSALVFPDAVAQSSWTLPATASLLTGRTPPRHGAVDVDTQLRPDAVTLAERLSVRGYRTAAFVTNSLVSQSYGFERGFSEFHLYAEKPLERPATYLPARRLDGRLRRWLERNATGAPFFLYVHATDPHWPYVPAPRHARPFRSTARSDDEERAVVRAAGAYFFGNEHHGERPTTMPKERVAVLSDLYDGEVRAADEAFGSLLDDLDRLGLLEQTAVVLTSDHGEDFLDHDGLGHGQTLHEEVLHVPLLVRLPGGVRGGERIERPVQQVDVAPTILDLAGVAFGDDVEGRSLLDTIDTNREIASHLDHLGVRFDSITTERWKAIRDLGRRAAVAPLAVYDRFADRPERHDLAPERTVLAGYARQRLRRAVTSLAPGPEVDAAVLARLRALGYVQE